MRSSVTEGKIMPVGILDPQQRIDPQLGFGFAVQLGDEILGWFTEFGALTIEREVKPQPEGGVNDYIHQLPGRLKRLNVTLKHGLAGNELWTWFQQGLYDVKIETRNISIVLYDGTLAEVRRWDLVDVYPAKWNGSTLNSSQQEVFIESVEFAYANSSAPEATVQRQENDQAISNPTSSQPDVDIQALAQKVYQLLKEELRVERERLG
jgi:phage tail-like protein